MHCGKTWISSLVLMSTFPGTDLPVLPISSRPCAVVLDIPTDVQGRSHTSHTIPYNGIVSYGAQIGGLWVFADHTHATTNAKQMHLRSLRTMQCFTRVYLHTQTAVDAGDIRTWRTTVILITGKSRRPPIWAPCWDKYGTGSGISLAYLWIYHKYCEK